MYREFTYDGVLASSQRAAWQLDDVLPLDAALDFARPFLPETLARTAGAAGLDPAEALVLNQIRGHEYLAMFGLVEEFILPFVLDHARPLLNGDDYRVRALLPKQVQKPERYHALVSRIVYTLEKDVTFFTEQRALDPAFMNAILPDGKIERRPDGTFRAGKRPANTFRVRFLGPEKLATPDAGLKAFLEMVSDLGAPAFFALTVTA